MDGSSRSNQNTYIKNFLITAEHLKIKIWLQMRWNQQNKNKAISCQNKMTNLLGRTN